MTKDLRAVLKDLGLRHDQAALWASFISHCLQYIGHAETELKSDWKKMLGKISGRKKSSPHIPEETDITKELYEYCHTYRKGRSLGDPMKVIVARCENPLPSKTKTGKESERIDLGFEHVDNDLMLEIEAKRMLESSSAAHYTGESGIGVFTIRDEPRTREPVGAMFGYVLKDCPNDWANKITTKHGVALAQNDQLHSTGELTLYSIEDREKLGMDKLLLLHRFADFTVQHAKAAPCNGKIGTSKSKGSQNGVESGIAAASLKPPITQPTPD